MAYGGKILMHKVKHYIKIHHTSRAIVAKYPLDVIEETEALATRKGALKHLRSLVN